MTTPAYPDTPGDRSTLEFAPGLPEVPGYRTVRPLGRGGFGEVVLAVDTATGKEVAVKVLVRTDPRAVARFEREVRSAARLNSPHVVTVYHAGSAGGRPFVAMEYCAGGSLADRLAERGPLGPREAARLIELVAGAVHEAHLAAVVHRDLKPHNVLLAPAADHSGAAVCTLHGEPFVPKVGDFGLAHAYLPLDSDAETAESLTRTNELVGTPAYMAPEQFLAHKPWPPTDVWALGVILFECLTGGLPYRGETALALRERVLGASMLPPPSARPQRPDLPADLDAVVQQCLRYQPLDRYRSARDLAADLRNFLDGRPVTARPYGPLGRAALWVRRNAQVAAVLALGVVAAGAFGFDRWRQAEARAADTRREVAAANQKWRAARTSGGRADWRRADDAFTALPPDAPFADERATFAAERDAALAEADRRDAAEREAGRDRNMRTRLERVRVANPVALSVNFDTARGYADAFRDYLTPDFPDGLTGADPAAVEAFLKTRSIRVELAAGLVSWLYAAIKANPLAGFGRPVGSLTTAQTLALARRVDLPDPQRAKVYDALSSALAVIEVPRLAESFDTAAAPTPTVLLLGEVVWGQNIEAAARFFRRALADHGHDFWVQHFYAASCHDLRPPDLDAALAARRVMAALRPDEPAAPLMLVAALEAAGREDEAVPVTEGMVRRWPRDLRGHAAFAQAAGRVGRYPEAVRALETVLTLIDPADAGTRAAAEGDLALMRALGELAARRLPSLREGRTDAEPAERTGLLQVAGHHRLWHAAARVADGLEAAKCSPGVRREAVTAFTEAGTSRAALPPLDGAADRARWRGLALQWAGSVPPEERLILFGVTDRCERRLARAGGLPPGEAEEAAAFLRTLRARLCK